MQFREFLHSNPAYLGQRRLYLLRNLSRGKGIGFFAADNFYPDFILWLVDGAKQRIVFVDPKGLAMLKPNDFSHPKIHLYRTLQEIAGNLDDPNVSLDSFIISDKPFTETQPEFGKLERTRTNFIAIMSSSPMIPSPSSLNKWTDNHDWGAFTEAERLMQWWGPKGVTIRGLPYNATPAERKTFAGAFASLEQGSKGTLDQLEEYLARA